MKVSKKWIIENIEHLQMLPGEYNTTDEHYGDNFVHGKEEIKTYLSNYYVPKGGFDIYDQGDRYIISLGIGVGWQDMYEYGYDF